MKKLFGMIFICSLPAAHISTSYAEPSSFTLDNTYWSKIAKSREVSPYLLYAIAIKESKIMKQGSDGKKIIPSMWAMNSPSTKGKYFDSKESLMNKVDDLYSKGVTNIDIGIMQINVKYHLKRVSELKDLSDPETNIRVGSDILKEALGSTSDIIRGVGRYHSGTKWRSYNYGSHALKIYFDLIKLAGVYETDTIYKNIKAKSVEPILSRHIRTVGIMKPKSNSKKKPIIDAKNYAVLDEPEKDWKESVFE